MGTGLDGTCAGVRIGAAEGAEIGTGADVVEGVGVLMTGEGEVGAGATGASGDVAGGGAAVVIFCAFASHGGVTAALPPFAGDGGGANGFGFD